MLARLALVIHWLLFMPAFIGMISILLWADELNLLETIGASLAPFIPSSIFTIGYWIVKKHWAFFPWQHVKPEE
jgi:hypothetical protein